MRIFNKKSTFEKRKVLRKNQTDAEIKLWAKLRNKQFLGVKFYRQYGISDYIADFYSPSLKLVIEIDGSQHYEDDAKEYDLIRERFFSSLGLKTVRFSNFEVLLEMNSVLGKIESFVH